VEEDIPEPGPAEVRVKVEAAGVSGYDVMLRSRSFPGFTKVPYTPGVDIVGIVDEVGDRVSTVERGDRVAGLIGLGGGYADYVCLPEEELVPVRSDVDAAAAVCLVANYLTAHLAMHETAHVQQGESILVHGAAGGVGSALLQLGNLAGLEMYGTASPYNHALVTSLGATPIDYRSEDFVARVRDLTGDGVDVVFDPIGGAGQVWRSSRALRKGGRLVWFGVAATVTSGIRVIPLSLATIGLLKILPDGKHAPLMAEVGASADQDRTWYRETLTELFDNLAAGNLEPVVAARFPIDEARRAHELLEQGGYAGKVVLVANE
jgi:NADPH2:quinone reductase